MLTQEILAIICCPETHQGLRPADEALVQSLNQRITAGGVLNRAGKPVAERIDGALVRNDGKIAYPIRQNIPILLVDEGIVIP